ncbi:MAG TPA: hypothetical protein VHO91_22310 [Rhodopila sp.]|nr:hypothetical protein [Rhodopila sp.]
MTAPSPTLRPPPLRLPTVRLPTVRGWPLRPRVMRPRVMRPRVMRLFGMSWPSMRSVIAGAWAMGWEALAVMS